MYEDDVAGTGVYTATRVERDTVGGGEGGAQSTWHEGLLKHRDMKRGTCTEKERVQGTPVSAVHLAERSNKIHHPLVFLLSCSHGGPPVPICKVFETGRVTAGYSMLLT